jgi:hypothetical protein
MVEFFLATEYWPAVGRAHPAYYPVGTGALFRE